MNRAFGAVGAVLSLMAALAPAARAQEVDAYVLAPGVVRVVGALHYGHWDRLFGATGTSALADPLLTPLSSGNFALLQATQEELNGFLAAQGSAVRADAQSYLLGTPDVAVSLDSRTAPLRVEVGVVPRLQLGVTVPLVRGDTRVSRFGVLGGTLGLNPDRDGNEEILAGLGEAFAAVGAAPLLPTAESALGRELQARVVAAGGDSLALPSDTTALRDAGRLGALVRGMLGSQAPESGVTPWLMGDAELDARFRLLGTFGAAPFPTDSARFHYRVSVSGGVRLPTGSEPDSMGLFSALPPVGLSGWRLGVESDWFAGRLWATVGARYAAFGDTEVVRRVAPLATLISTPVEPSAVSWAPGSELRVSVAPRFRLTESIALGAEYDLLRVGDSRYRDAAVLDLAGGTVQRAGVQLRYSTLANYLAGARLIPIEAVLGYQATLSGPEGAPESRTVRVQLSLFRQLWGRPSDSPR